MISVGTLWESCNLALKACGILWHVCTDPHPVTACSGGMHLLVKFHALQRDMCMTSWVFLEGRMKSKLLSPEVENEVEIIVCPFLTVPVVKFG